VSTPSRRGWSTERRVGTAQALHAPWPDPSRREDRVVALCSVSAPPAIVLGSTQSDDIVDRVRASGAGVEIVRRSSGGGAVLVGPNAQVWLEVWVSRTDPLWDDDVIRSSWWLGETWARALEGLGAPALSVHRGRAVPGTWSDVVCFAGVGPGEVMAGQAKVVGVSQRRTRHGARLHSMALLSWEPASWLGLLALDSERDRTVEEADDELADVATGVRSILRTSLRDEKAEVVISSVEEALLSALP
jgi:lipoate-protein ligase A